MSRPTRRRVRRRMSSGAQDVLSGVLLVLRSSEALLQDMRRHTQDEPYYAYTTAYNTDRGTDETSCCVGHVINTLHNTLRPLCRPTTTYRAAAAASLRYALQQLLHVWCQMRRAAPHTTRHAVHCGYTRRCGALRRRLVTLCAQIVRGSCTCATNCSLYSTHHRRDAGVAGPRRPLPTALPCHQPRRRERITQSDESVTRLQAPRHALCPLLVLHVDDDDDAHTLRDVPQLVSRSRVVYMSESVVSCLGSDAAQRCSIGRPAAELLACHVVPRRGCMAGNTLCRLSFPSSSLSSHEQRTYMALVHAVPVHGRGAAQWQAFLHTERIDCRHGRLVLVFLLCDAARHTRVARRSSAHMSAQTARSGACVTLSAVQADAPPPQAQSGATTMCATRQPVRDATGAAADEKASETNATPSSTATCAAQPSGPAAPRVGEAAFPAAGMTSTRGHVVDNVTPHALAARLHSVGAVATVLLSRALPARFMMNLFSFMAFAQVLVRQQRAMGVGEVACFVNVRARTFLVADFVPTQGLVDCAAPGGSEEAVGVGGDVTHKGSTVPPQHHLGEEDTQGASHRTRARQAMRALETYYAAESRSAVTAAPCCDQAGQPAHTIGGGGASSGATASTSATIPRSMMLSPSTADVVVCDGNEGGTAACLPPLVLTDALFSHLVQCPSLRQGDGGSHDSAPLPLSHSAAADCGDVGDSEQRRAAACSCALSCPSSHVSQSSSRAGHTGGAQGAHTTASGRGECGVALGDGDGGNGEDDVVPLESFLDAHMVAHLRACEAALWLRRGGAATLVFPFITQRRLTLLARRNGGNLDGGKNLFFYGIPLANALTEALAAQQEADEDEEGQQSRAATAADEGGHGQAVDAAAEEDGSEAATHDAVAAQRTCSAPEANSPSASQATLPCALTPCTPPCTPPLPDTSTVTPDVREGHEGAAGGNVSALPTVLPAAADDQSDKTRPSSSVTPAVAQQGTTRRAAGQPVASAEKQGGSSSSSQACGSAQRVSGTTSTSTLTRSSSCSKSERAAAAGRRVRVVPLFAGYEPPRGVCAALASCTQALRYSHLRTAASQSASTSRHRASRDGGGGSSGNTDATKAVDSRTSRNATSRTATSSSSAAATGDDGTSRDAPHSSGHECHDAMDAEESDTAAAELNSAASVSSSEHSYRLHVLVYTTAVQPTIEETLMAQGHCVTFVTTPTKMLAYLRVGLAPFDVVVVDWCAPLVTDEISHRLRHRTRDAGSEAARHRAVGGTVVVYHCAPDSTLPLPCDAEAAEEEVVGMSVVRRGTDFARTAIESCAMRRTRRCIRRTALLRTLACQRVTQSLEIVRQLGSGACGDVFEVYLYASKGRLAMKRVFLKDASLHLLELLHREVTLMRVMDHPNVIAFSHTLLDESAFSICMELGDGTLAQRIANPALTLAWRPRSGADVAALRPHTCSDACEVQECHVTAPRARGGGSSSSSSSGVSCDVLQRCQTSRATSSVATTTAAPSRMSPQEAVLIVHDIASGIAYLHHKGIIHRDIKPQNILFVNGVAKIADFGSAVRVSEPGPRRLAEMKGTLLYMAPEVLLGEAYGAPCDLWSFGCLIADIMGIRFGHLHGLHVPALVELYRSIPTTQSLPITVTAHADVALDTPRSRDATREVLAAVRSAACVSGRNVAADGWPSCLAGSARSSKEAVGAAPLSPDCVPVTSASSSRRGGGGSCSRALRSVTCLHTSRDAGLKTGTALLPASLVDLFEQLFHRDPARRMTIDALLEHPVAWDVEWMTEMMSAVQDMVDGLTQLGADETKEGARPASDSLSFSSSSPPPVGNSRSSSGNASTHADPSVKLPTTDTRPAPAT